MASKTPKRSGQELFYTDKDGKKQDASLHAEILGPDDQDPFAFDMEDFVKMSPKEQAAFLKNRHKA